MKIRVIDEASPEDVAMLQALYSRSADSVDEHVNKLKLTGSGKFMERYYVGYGHKSIADCGSTTMFIEGVSLLAAKAIQDSPLYSGQETSTRYINMAEQKIIDPIGSPESKAILDRWMDFYRDPSWSIFDHIVKTHPRLEGEDATTYERAANARMFDVMRGFLPAGITTQLSWHSNLRQAGDHLQRLRFHPLAEVRDIAHELGVKLDDRYSHSGFRKEMTQVSGVENSAQIEQDRAAWLHTVTAYPSHIVIADRDGAMAHSFNYNTILRPSIATLLRSRPRGCVLPHWMTDFGQGHFEFYLDFGSFRDLQRHRNGVVRMPLLTVENRFESWYLEQLPPIARAKAEELLVMQHDAIHALAARGHEKTDLQYLTALGYHVPCRVTFALPALLYFLELRSQRTVHPTLRAKVRQMVRLFREEYPEIALHADNTTDDWTIRRGQQTITER